MNGYTVIEILIVVAIVAILATTIVQQCGGENYIR